MHSDELWAAIDSQRERVATMLESLTEEQWRQASLCDGWTIRDVGAHLTLQQLTLWQGLRGALRHPGSLNTVINRTARSAAAELSTDEIIRRIRAMVGQRRHNVGLTARETLIDALVHGLDIAIPLGLDLPMDTTAAAEAASRVWDTRRTWRSRVFRAQPLDGYRFRATDASWSVGEGVEVVGPIGAILLLLTGRPTRVGELAGPGADAVRRGLALT